MFLWMAILLFVLGLIVGGFLNVFIYRVPRKISLIRVSRCPRCDQALRVREIIPLLSYLTLRGKCRYCRKAISLRYPLVETLTGLLFAALFSQFGVSFKTPVAFFFASVLLAAGAIDIQKKIIPNKLVLPGLAIGLFFLTLKIFFNTDFLPLAGVSSSPLAPLLGMLLGGGLIFIPNLINADWMGGGDVKLSAFMGLFLGKEVLLALFFGSFIGGVTGITLKKFKKLAAKDTLPFGPFLALGAFMALFLRP